MQPSTETTVKSYSTPQAFQRDQLFLAMQGWQVMNTTSVQPRAGLGRIALIGFGALLFKPKPQIIVTYQRILRAGQLQQEQMPAGLSFWQKQKWIREHTPKGLSPRDAGRWAREHYNRE